AAAGRWAGAEASCFGVPLVAAFGFVGELFLNALKMLIVPLIASSMIVGVAGLGSGSLGRLGGKTLGLYALTSLCAIALGLGLINLVEPGLVGGQPARDLLALGARPDEVTRAVGGRGAADIVGVFLRMLPPNVVAAASDNAEMLGLIVFSLLFGAFIPRLEARHSAALMDFWQAVFQVMMRMTGLVMSFAPIGVFALVARVVAKAGFAAAQPLAVFALLVLAGLAVHMFLVLPLTIRLFTGLRPWAIFPALGPALLTAFSTASSTATLPVNMECVERRAGVSNRVCSFVLPLGATINMNGTALYECSAVLFLAQAYGLRLGLATQFLVVLLALLTSVGVAGIPAASLVAIAVILQAVGLPAEAVGVLLVFDRVLDMARTSVNIFGDACCAVIVAHSEGEKVLRAAGPVSG
ncbi:MAG: dicarboxylate/amino acid:cation symporter, partial [Elusimicrobia bacterium]|nr:dicarboxylate/amino acid:cation symporter [Elusimicrobiota bacterium]